MGHIFDADNMFFRGLSKVIDCIVVSFFFMLCNAPSLLVIGASIYSNAYGLVPVILAFSFLTGPSLCGLYYTCLKSIRRSQSYAWKEYWIGFKNNFKQGTVGGFIITALMLFNFADALFFYYQDASSSLRPLFYVFVIIAFVVLMWGINLFSYIARFELDIKNILKNSLIIALANLPKSFALGVIFIAVILGCYMIPIIIFLVPAFYMLIKSLLMEPTFRKYMSEEDLETEKEFDREAKR